MVTKSKGADKMRYLDARGHKSQKSDCGPLEIVAPSRFVIVTNLTWYDIFSKSYDGVSDIIPRDIMLISTTSYTHLI